MTTRPNPRLREKVASRQCVGNNDACWVSDSSTLGPHSPYTRRMIWVLSHNGLVGVAPVHRQMTARETAAATGKFKWLLFESCSSPTLPTMPVLPGNFDCIRSGSGDLDDLNNLEHVGYGIPQPPIKRQSSKLLTPLIHPILGLSRSLKLEKWSFQSTFWIMIIIIL